MNRELSTIAKNARIKALQMVNHAKSAHIGSSLSVIDIATVLFSESLSNTQDQDVVLVSKGHAAAGIYAVLSELGEIPDSWIEAYGENGAPLGGHVTSTNVPILELSTGSLGHALPFGVGRALGKKRKGQGGRVFVIISDGECDEGSNWEAALLANHLNLNNLVVVIDRNRLQSLGDTETTVALEPLADKWRAFNWDVIGVDGHDIDELKKVIKNENPLKPRVIIANTLKGKGVSFMENSIKWHYRPPDTDELLRAIGELL